MAGGQGLFSERLIQNFSILAVHSYQLEAFQRDCCLTANPDPTDQDS